MPHTDPEVRHSRLARDALLVLDDARDVTVTVESGVVWLTLERDSRDVILEPGERFRIDRPGRTVLMAHTPAAVRLSRPLRFAALHRATGVVLRALRKALLEARPRMVPYV